MFTSQVIQWNVSLVLCLGIWWRHKIWKYRNLKFGFLENKKSFWSEIKNIFPSLTSALINTITLLILEIKLTHYSSSVCACLGMPDHTHLQQPTNSFCFYGPLVTSKNSTSYPNFTLRYSSLKSPAFWLDLRFLNHNSRTRLFPNMLFLQIVKRLLTLSRWTKKIYISEWIRFLLKP